MNIPIYEQDDSIPVNPISQTRFFLAATLLAFCSVLYELLLAKIIVDTTGDAITWESITIAGFLAGIGLRAYSGIHDRGIALLDRLLEAEKSIVVAALCAYPGMIGIEMLYRIYFYDLGLLREQTIVTPIVMVGLLGQIFSFAIGWASGAEIVFFLSAPSPHMVGPMESRAAKVLAIYHLGAFLGTGAFVGMTLVGTDPAFALLWVAGINFVILAMLYQWRRQFKRSQVLQPIYIFRMLAPMAGLFLVTATIIGPLTTLKLKNRYFNQYSTSFDQFGLTVNHNPWWLKSTWNLISEAPTVLRTRSPYQVIDRIDDPGREALFINGRFQIDQGTAAAYHTSLALPVMALMGKIPEKVLILGGGDGVLAGTLARFRPSLGLVDLVDIDAAIVHMAREVPWMRILNGDALNHWQSLQVHVTDAVAFLRARVEYNSMAELRNKKLYDLIYIDLTYPYEADSVRFYSVEFLRMVGQNLGPLGAIALGIPHDLVQSGLEPWVKGFLATLSQAGFTHLSGYSYEASHFAVVSKSPQLAEPLLSLVVPQMQTNLEKNGGYQSEFVGLKKSFAPLRWIQLRLAPSQEVSSEVSSEVFSLLKPGNGTIEDSFY